MKQLSKLFSIKDAAVMMGVTIHTVRNWDRDGKIKVSRTPGGHRRISMFEIDRINRVEAASGSGVTNMISILKDYHKSYDGVLSRDIGLSSLGWNLSDRDAMSVILDERSGCVVEDLLLKDKLTILKTRNILGFPVVSVGDSTELIRLHRASVVVGFPGVGKTHLADNAGDLVILDSDSSSFDKSDFPNNYVKHIKSHLDDADVILVSSHIAVRKALREADIQYIMVVPVKEAKKEYRKRFEDRGSSSEFIDLIMDNWDNYLDNCSKDTTVIKIKDDTYLSDVVLKKEN